MAKSQSRLQARLMRKNGKSIKEIAKILKVSTSSVSIWCRDILLSEKQILELQFRMTDPYYGKRMEYVNKLKKAHTEKVTSLVKQGEKELGILNKRDIFILGVGLYWGEGFKKDSQLGLATSDILAAKYFIYWLKELFHISNNDLLVRVTLNSVHSGRVKEIEKYWSFNLNIPLSQFAKPFFQKSTLKKVYENKSDYHGVIRIKLRKSKDKLRLIYGFIKGIETNLS